MLQQVFGGGQMTRISELRNRFYTTVPLLKTQIMSALKSKGMYTLDPDSAAGFWVLGAIVVAAPYAAMQWLGIADFFSGVLAAVVSIATAVVIVFLFGNELTAKSMQAQRPESRCWGLKNS
jgi:hypothetical protein